MSAHKFEIVRNDDEHERIILDGREIARTNHDEDGWAGMDRVRNVVKAIAKKLGAEFVQR